MAFVLLGKLLYMRTAFNFKPYLTPTREEARGSGQRAYSTQSSTVYLTFQQTVQVSVKYGPELSRASVDAH